MENITISMPCLFGVEGIAANEVKFKLGRSCRCTDGRVCFDGPVSDVASANLLISTAERVQILLGSFHATTFDELFEGMKALPLERFIPKDGAFPVKGWSLNSKLASVPDCQSILKKAAVERLKTKYHLNWFAETGAVYQLAFSIFRDEVHICLDTTGQGLHKRGYRREGGIAPIKETLAAAIADCARIKAYHRVIDPCCGSGTLLIEAARKALNIAPGIDRKFAFEAWPLIPAAEVAALRAQAAAGVRPVGEFSAQGYDILPEAVTLTADNAAKAGVGDCVKAELRSLSDFRLPDGDQKTIVLANPPYGERLLDIEAAQKLYQQMGRVFEPRERCAYYIISPDEDFESWFGRKATKRRKLYNGMIRCWLYMYE